MYNSILETAVVLELAACGKERESEHHAEMCALHVFASKVSQRIHHKHIRRLSSSSCSADEPLIPELVGAQRPAGVKVQGLGWGIG